MTQVMTRPAVQVPAPAAETPSAAEEAVKEARAELAATIDQLKYNLRPAHLVREVMAGPQDRVKDALSVYGRFARHSPVSGLVIGAAALLFAGALVRRERRR